MRYSLIREMDISNGEGIGISLFVQGCHFHCQGCFNQDTWDFEGGKLWTDEIKQQFIALADKPYIKRISILGGEPLAPENVYEVCRLIIELKTLYPNKQIWLYTGYEWEEILNNKTKTMFLAAISADVLCEGRFRLKQQELYNEYSPWVGSTNQRVINPYISFKEGRVVRYEH